LLGGCGAAGALLKHKAAFGKSIGNSKRLPLKQMRLI